MFHMSSASFRRPGCLKMGAIQHADADPRKKNEVTTDEAPWIAFGERYQLLTEAPGARGLRWSAS